MKILHILVVATIFCQYGDGYNLEGRLPLYKIETEGGRFGFSVALHRTSSDSQSIGSIDKSLLVVGSPTASALPTQTDTTNPGAVFYCPVTTNPRDCTRVMMDRGGSTELNNKTDQWLGVSLKSQGDGKYLITCAHRHSSRWGIEQNEKERVCGKCFLLNSRGGSNKLYEVPPNDRDRPFISSPCDRKNNPTLLNSKYLLAYTQAGVSASWMEDEYLLGGPGAYAWSGGMFDYNMSEITPNPRSTRGQYETLGCQSDGTEAQKVKCDNIPLRRDSYMGFSVATSNALNNAGLKDNVYLAGAPRGNFSGAVVMYTKRQSGTGRVDLVPNAYIVKGKQIGSSFGFSIAVTDINSDGLDDLLVGAPQYYEYSNKGKYGGAVYIYINSRLRDLNLVTPKVLFGKPDSFFGYSIAPLGDIDRDGYNDFAIGAPYEENGKVYVYRGSADGVARLSQVFDGSNYKRFRPDLSGFGIALSGGVDIDNNKYPDLMVGSLSDQVVLFRSRPIIKLNSSLETNISVIDLKLPKCTYKGKTYPCFSVKFCFSYSSRHKEYAEELAINYTVTLDSQRQKDNKRSRVRFDSPLGASAKSEVMNIPKAGSLLCPGDVHEVFFKKNLIDRLRPVHVELDFSLVSDGRDVTPEANGAPLFRMIEDPILDADLPDKRSRVVVIQNDCGDDGCQSNLKVGGKAPKEIVVGGTDKITLQLNASNDREEAHQASVSVKLPPNIYYNNYTVSNSSGAEISCKATDQGGSTFVTCSLGNPYANGSMDTINIDLDASKLTPSTKRVVFEVTGSTVSENPEIPVLLLYSNVVIEMQLTLTGTSRPQQVQYSDELIRGESAIVYTDEIGPMINHTFTIRNDGQQIAGGVLLVVKFPHEIRNGKWLLYLVSSEVMAGGNLRKGKCSQENVNVLAYKLPSARMSPARPKRGVKEPSALYEPKRVSTVSSEGVYGSTLGLNCPEETAECLSIECVIEPIQSETTISVFFQSRLWNATFLEEFRDVDLVDVGVLGKLKNVDDNVRITGKHLVKEIFTTVDHTFVDDDIVSVFPWWYILIGILIALIVYAFIIFLLIRCGFFKRKRYHVQEPEDNVTLIEERPLDRRD